MEIKNAKYSVNEFDKTKTIQCDIDGQSMGVPIDENNRHYVEIKKQVDAGELTIEDAD